MVLEIIHTLAPMYKKSSQPNKELISTYESFRVIENELITIKLICYTDEEYNLSKDLIEEERSL